MLGLSSDLAGSRPCAIGHSWPAAGPASTRTQLSDAPPRWRCIQWLVQSVARTLAYRCWRVNEARRREGQRLVRHDRSDRRRSAVTARRATAPRDADRPSAIPPDERADPGVDAPSRRIADAVGRLPAGGRSSAGIPFAFAASTRPSPLAPARPARSTSTCVAHGTQRHVVVAHFCDAWRDPVAGRPPTCPIGWVTPVGQPLARYTVEPASGRTVERVVRRRFEINDGIVGLGPGRVRRGPASGRHAARLARPTPGARHRRATPSRARPACSASCRAAGVRPRPVSPTRCRARPATSPSGCYALEIPRDRRGAAAPAASGWSRSATLDEGGGVVVGAVTAFRGSASPLADPAPADACASIGRAATAPPVARRPRPGLPARPSPRPRPGARVTGGRRLGYGPRAQRRPARSMSTSRSRRTRP